ncbi:MAG: MFS transporter [Acidobacteria bacterium]|nr:MFS transporter [Acidobacteriota bacterium]
MGRELSRTFVFGLMAAALLTPLGSTMIAVALPTIAHDVGRDAGSLTPWLVLSYLVVGMLGQSPGGRLGDRIGHRRALLGGVGLFAAGAVLGLASRALAGLVAARVLMAVGGAVTIPAVLAALRNGTEGARRMYGFATFTSVMSVGASVGPWLGGELVAHFGWRAVFAANLPLIALALPLIARSDAAHTPAPAPAPRGGGWGLVPLLGDARLFRRREFAAGSLVIGLQNLAQYGLLFLVPIEIERRAGAGPEQAGRALLAMLAGNVVFAPLGARLAVRSGSRFTAVLGSTLATLAFVALPASFEPGLRLFVALAAVGAGIGLASAPAQTAALSAAPRAQAGAAGGALSTMRYLGAAVGIALLKIEVGGEPAASIWLRAGSVALVASILLALVLRGGDNRSRVRGPRRAGEHRALAERPELT